MKLPSNLGMLCLAIYLILIALGQLVGLGLGSLGVIVPILALLAGIFILVGR